MLRKKREITNKSSYESAFMHITNILYCKVERLLVYSRFNRIIMSIL